MKRLLLLGLAVCLAAVSYPQKRARIAGTHVNKSVHAVHIPFNTGYLSAFTQIEKQAMNGKIWEDETQIGTTFYDRQTNASLSNRFYRYQDGKMAYVWTRGITSAGDWPDKGTAYNYYDGTEWEMEPSLRIESVRTGYPTYAPLGANGEIVVSQDSANLQICKREQKGTGTWIESSLAGPPGLNLICPKVVTNGTDRNTIHLLAASDNVWLGQSQALLYSRSQDGGLTWEISCMVIPGTGADSYSGIEGDEYSWAEPRANTLAFLVSSRWHDMFMMKSTDNGDTWTKTVIWQHPYPMWNWSSTITTDTIWCPESSSIAMDYQGNAHVAFGIGRVAHTAAGTAYSFWPYTDGIGYWNEDMPPFTNANQHKALCTYPGYLVEDVNLIGWMQDMNGDGVITLIDPPYSYNPQIGMSTMPSITLDDNQGVFIAWASLMEDKDNLIFNYKHIWMRASNDWSQTWSGFYDPTSSPIHSFDECILPQLSANSDDNIYLAYNADDGPGLALSDPPDHNLQENRQNYFAIPIDYFYWVPSIHISTSSNPSLGGTTSGGGMYNTGSPVYLLATPAQNYIFHSWTENGNLVSMTAAYNFTAYDNRTLVANFYPYEGINPEQTTTCKVYPNPTSGQLILESGNAESFPSEISLINSTGCQVYKKADNFSDKTIIDLSDKNQGIYNLRIVFADGKSEVFKIVRSE
jgi:hypothetical protein